MKSLVVYYSLEGNTKFVSEVISETTSSGLLQLKPKDDVKSQGFMKYLRGGKQVFTNAKPELSPLDENPEDYDVLFIGTPVWAGSYAPALGTLFDEFDLTGKKVALFCCHRGGKGKVFKKMKEKLPGSEVVGETDFIDPAKKDKKENGEKAWLWAKEITAHFD